MIMEGLNFKFLDPKSTKVFFFYIGFILSIDNYNFYFIFNFSKHS